RVRLGWGGVVFAGAFRPEDPSGHRCPDRRKVSQGLASGRALWMLAQLTFRQVARSFRTNLSASVWASRLVAKLNIDVSRSRSVSKTSQRYRPGRFASSLTR